MPAATARADEIVGAEPTSIMAGIARAIADRSTPVERLEPLVATYERLAAADARAAFAADFIKLQMKLPEISKDGSLLMQDDLGRNRDVAHAKWEDIDEAIKPILAKNHFGLNFKPAPAGKGEVAVTAVLWHKKGVTDEATVTLPHDLTGGKNGPQAAGSAITYAKRYAAVLVLNIRTRGDDDDGAAAGDGQVERITLEQVTNLTGLIDDAGMDRQRLLNTLRIDGLTDLPASRYADVLRLIGEKRAHDNRNGGRA